jgi:macrolide transport system ATP-binding/permease protein
MPAGVAFGQGIFTSDLRLALRRLRRAPGFVVAAVVTLGLGLGATTAIFTLFNAVLLEELPVERPQDLALLGGGLNCCVVSGLQKSWSVFSAPLYNSLRIGTPELSPLAAFQAEPSTVSVRRAGSTAAALPARSSFVSGNYFQLLSVRPVAGRLLVPADDAPAAPPTVILSHRLWERAFGSDLRIVGSTILLNGQPMTVAGIAPPQFVGEGLRPDPAELWLPLSAEPLVAKESSLLARADLHWLHVMGRLRPGISPAGVSAKLTGEVKSWLRTYGDVPEPYRREIDQSTVLVERSPGGVGVIQRHVGTGLRLLMALSIFVLLIACANLANLLLARGAAQRSQLAVRRALGASWGRLVRQSLTESLLLAVAGSVLGVGFAYAGTRSLLALAFRGSQVSVDPNPSLGVLLCALAAALVTGALFGALPAWVSLRTQAAEALRGGSRATRDRASLPQRSLIVFQSALSLVLLALAGLLATSLDRLEHQDFGFVATHRLSVQVKPLLAGYTPERLPALYRALEERLGALPGVESVGLGLYGPMQDQWNGPVSVVGRPADGASTDQAAWDRVSAGFFDAVGQPVVQGRPFTFHDTPSSPKVVVVNQTFVRQYLGGQNPLDSHFGQGGVDSRGDYEIVGVVRDAKYFEADQPTKPMFFLPLSQPGVRRDPGAVKGDIRQHYISSIIVKTSPGAAGVASAVRRSIADVDPNLTILGLQSLSDEVSTNFNGERLVAVLTTLFGLLALVLAGVGIYGVTAYMVTARTSEIGIRMALGARRSAVLGLVLRSALVQVGLGLVLGVPIALGAGRLVASQLYQVGSADPAVLGGAIVVLTLAALCAAWLPARRAAQTNPMTAVRSD